MSKVIRLDAKHYFHWLESYKGYLGNNKWTNWNKINELGIIILINPVPWSKPTVKVALLPKEIENG